MVDLGPRGGQWGEVVASTLTGTYARSLDDKQRLAIPKKMREEFGDPEPAALYIAPGTDRSLFLYSPEAFARLADRFAEASSQRPDVRNYQRLFYAQAENLPLDGQGRIRIPERLVALAGLKKDLVLLGVRDHAEIWEQSAWDEFLARTTPGFDDLAAHVFDQ